MSPNIEDLHNNADEQDEDLEEREERLDGRPKEMIFVYNNSVPTQKQEALEKIVLKLGGRSLLNKTEYVSNATHLVLNEGKCNVINPMILGFLASRKPIVLLDFLNSSKKAKKWLLESDYQPTGLIQDAFDSLKDHQGKAFKGLNLLFFLRDKEKESEFRRVLRDGGAVVPDWTIQDLQEKSDSDFTDVQKILTEPCIADSDEDFKSFKSNRSKIVSKIGIFSYFYLYRHILSKEGTEDRERIETAFEINTEMVRKMHGISVESDPSEASTIDKNAETSENSAGDGELKSDDDEEVTSEQSEDESLAVPVTSLNQNNPAEERANGKKTALLKSKRSSNKWTNDSDDETENSCKPTKSSKLTQKSTFISDMNKNVTKDKKDENTLQEASKENSNKEKGKKSASKSNKMWWLEDDDEDMEKDDESPPDDFLQRIKERMKNPVEEESHLE